jgi:tRNA nucleotidyltransferase (CCA-adding enzyme)
MGMVPHDWDITTSATPAQVKAVFRRTHDTGIAHGTVTVLCGRSAYEVTTYRIDGEYTDHRRPDGVEFTQNLTEDLRRRDFTMNAIAYGPTSFIDPFGGITDIERRIIRGVGDPARRFQEDALRMLRCVRFAAQLGFDVDRETYEALKANAALIQKISAERIREELIKLLAGRYTSKLALLTESGLIKYIFTEYEYFYDTIHSTAALLQRLERKTPSFCFALLFRGLAPSFGKELRKKLKFDNKTTEETAGLLKYIQEPFAPLTTLYQVRRKMSEAGSELFSNALYLKYLLADEPTAALDDLHEKYEKITAAGDCLRLADLKINGTDILSLPGFESPAPGKLVGSVLAYLLDLVLRNPQHNEKAILSELAVKYMETERVSITHNSFDKGF